MKKFISKVQNLSQKAAHLRQVVEAAPAQAAQIRDTVLMTAGQLQQMRQDLQGSVTGLRADNGDRLAQALREINDHADVLLQAGYALSGVDMELSPSQRLIVHLEKVESVPEPNLRALMSANSGRQTIYSLLAALAKADGISESIHLSNLTYRELIVHVGPTPSVRLCWWPDSVADAASVLQTSGPAPVTAPPLAVPPPLSSFVSSSYFEPRQPASASSPALAPPPLAHAPLHDPATAFAPAEVSPSSHPAAAPTNAPAAQPATSADPYSTHSTAYTTRPPSAVAGSDWKKSALERFKKMPEGSKYRR
jgi:hypothetical protein